MTGNTRAFYNNFAFAYPLIDFFLRKQKREMCLEVNKQPLGSLLEIGVGNGSHLQYYSGHKITGIDNSKVMLKHAASNAPINARLLEMDARTLAFKDNSFDYVVLSHVIAVLDNPDSVLLEIERVLKPGGRLFILNHFTPDGWRGYLDRFFQPVSVLFHFKSVFRISDLKTILKFIPVKQVAFGSYYKLIILQKC